MYRGGFFHSRLVQKLRKNGGKDCNNSGIFNCHKSYYSFGIIEISQFFLWDLPPRVTHLEGVASGVSHVHVSTFHSQNLIKLDLSHNGLSSTKLGTEVQLEDLQELLLSNNKILALRSEELDFLSNSSLQKLDLSSNPLKEVRSGGEIISYATFRCV